MDDERVGTATTAAGGGCAIISAIVAIIVIINSFDSLDAAQIGLDFNRILSRVDETRGYGNGRYWLGIGHRFIKYPSAVQSIKFSSEPDADWQELRSRTSDGLEVKLEVEFNFQLSLFNAGADDTPSLVSLYNRYGGPDDYRKFFTLLAIDELTQLATRYNASTVFSQRDRVGDDMKMELNDLFGREAFCNVTNVQLKTLTLPPTFEEAIRETQVAAEKKRTATAERSNQVVSAETEVLQSEQEAERIQIDAQAAAETIRVNNEAFIAQFLFSQGLQAERLSVIYDQLDRNETLLMDYLNMRAVRDHPSDRAVINFGRFS